MTKNSNWRQHLKKNSYVEIQTSYNDDGRNRTRWDKAKVVHVKRCIKYRNQQILKNEIKFIICELEDGTIKVFEDLYNPTLVEFGTHKWVK